MADIAMCRSKTRHKGIGLYVYLTTHLYRRWYASNSAHIYGVHNGQSMVLVNICVDVFMLD